MKIGIMNNPSLSVYDEIEAIGKAGYDFVDLTIEGPIRHLNTKRIQALLEKHELFVVGHTDPCLPFAYPIESIRSACLKELERCAKIFSKLGAKVMNVHPCYSAPPAMKQDILGLNIQALNPIVQMVSSYDLTLALENFTHPFSTVSNYTKLLSSIPGIGIHLDFGHANLGQDDGEAFCRHLGSYIRHVHFSDNRATGDHHMPIGVGNIDWEKSILALKQIGYDATVTLEVFCGNQEVLSKYLEVSRRFVIDLWNR